MVIPSSNDWNMNFMTCNFNPNLWPEVPGFDDDVDTVQLENINDKHFCYCLASNRYEDISIVQIRNIVIR